MKYNHEDEPMIHPLLLRGNRFPKLRNLFFQLSSIWEIEYWDPWSKIMTPYFLNSPNPLKELFLDPEKCTACMSCILACSFHHAKIFDREIASISVSTHKKEREVRLSIQSAEEGKRLFCDHCAGEKEPLCVKYCAAKAIDFKVHLE